ncbi:MAG: ABC transporter substrate-binding protein [Pseudomonadota bacterium]
MLKFKKTTLPAQQLRRMTIAAMLCAGTLGFSGLLQAQAPAPLQIGILSDMSGPYIDLSGPGSVVAAKMAIEDFGGKVLNRPIQLLEGDHLNKPDVGLNLARKWYDGGARAIFDIGITTVALGVQDLAKEKDRIAVFTSSASSDLTGVKCSPNGVHWVYNSYMQSLGVVKAMQAKGGKSWYFITIDYTYGKNVQRDTTQIIEAGGGKVIGSTLHALNSTDFSSQLLQAQASKADVIGLATTTAHAAAAVKQAEEFGITAKQAVAPLSLTLHDTKAIGLKSGQGLLETSAFYWDQNDATRKFAARYKDRFGKMPNMAQAGVYSAVNHYLKSVAAAGTDETAKVMAKMKSTPINDFMTKNATIREDGQVMREVYVLQAKKPSESKNEWDLSRVVATIPANEAFLPASKACPLVK